MIYSQWGNNSNNSTTNHNWIIHVTLMTVIGRNITYKDKHNYLRYTASLQQKKTLVLEKMFWFFAIENPI